MKPNSDSTVTPAHKVIMVVDDDPNVRTILTRALSSLYDVREASDGDGAARALSQFPTPDLILLDVMMPKVNGLEFAAAVKARSEYRSIPIIFLTARTSAPDFIKGIQAGARAYLTKPFSLVTLKERVARALG